MTTDVDTISADASVGDARRLLEAGGHGAYPLVDEAGRCVGVVAKGDLLADGTEDNAPLGAIASRDVVSVAPDDTVLTALQRILEEEVEHLPVLVDDHLVGICTRTDILRARRRQFEHERAQRGWRPRFRSPLR